MKFCTRIIVALLAFSIAGASFGVQAPWVLTLEGLGPIKIGMSLSTVNALKGIKLKGTKPGIGEDSCYLESIQGITGVTLMIAENKVARINIDTKHFKTTAGAHLGMSESQLRSIYQGKLEKEPHRYEAKGHYYTLEDQENHRALRFETKSNKIIRMYTGRDPEVYFVENCS